MDKLKFETKSGAERNINRIAELFPEVITEARDKDGNLVKSVNLDTLKNLFGSTVEGRAESYDFTWVGKREAMIEAGTPIRKTLRPVRIDETVPSGADSDGKPYCSSGSVNWDTTQNLYIEGDNLDVLKLLTDSYLGKVKMIYIDPPYNTGNDFVYNDSFVMDREEYDEDTERVDKAGNINFRQNLTTNPRFHSDWCSMIYARLKVARNLLTDDGCIFLSIDDHELANLKRICDEVFGASNYLGLIARATGTTTGQDANILGNSLDYCLCYTKNSDSFLLGGIELTEDDIKRFNMTDDKGAYSILQLRKTGTNDRREDRPNMYYEITAPNGDKVVPIGPTGYESCWRVGIPTFNELVEDGMIVWKEMDREYAGGKVWTPYVKFYLEGRTKKPSNLWTDLDGNKKGSIELKGLLGEKNIFSNPKPTQFIMMLTQLIADTRNSIILDFFSGSSATAQAVMQLNAKDNGNRRFIMVQLDENTDEKSSAFKAGYKNICEIGKERIRRAGAKIADENRMTVPDLDTGFRVFKLDDSNFKDVHFSAGQVAQMSTFDTLAENLKEDRTAEDLLYSCILEWGLPLTLTHTEETIEGKKVFVVNGGDLIACFESDLPESVIKAIAARKPLNALFRESCFIDSPAKINNEEIFKLISPSTKVKVL